MSDIGETSDGFHTFNELYEHRNLLFVLVLASLPETAWASRTHKDGSSYDGWFIAGVDLPTGQVTYHLPERLWPAVERLGLHRHEAPEWDGHTSQDVIERLSALLPFTGGTEGKA